MTRDDPILQKCRKVMEDLYGPRFKGLVLYGSTARGTDTAESDIDLLVLLEGPVNVGEEIFRVSEAVYPVELDCERLISVMPADVGEYERGESNLYQNVLAEGVPI